MVENKVTLSGLVAARRQGRRRWFDMVGVKALVRWWGSAEMEKFGEPQCMHAKMLDLGHKISLDRLISMLSLSIQLIGWCRSRNR